VRGRYNLRLARIRGREIATTISQERIQGTHMNKPLLWAAALAFALAACGQDKPPAPKAPPPPPQKEAPKAPEAPKAEAPKMEQKKDEAKAPEAPKPEAPKMEEKKDEAKK
jgi:hypothetical protein